MKHLTEEDLVLLYYREPGAPEGARTHLAGCAECRASAESLARALSVCNEWTVPDPGPEFARSVWAQLAPRIEPVPRKAWISALWKPRVWAAAAAVAVLVMAAFIAGRATRHPEPVITAGLSGPARARILAISLADHLDRAEMLLTEISNAGADNFPVERDRAQDLVNEGRLMRQSLAQQGDASTLALVDDVERFMLEVANSPDHVTPEVVSELQERIGAGSLLFKVRIIESNLRAQGKRI